MSLPELREAVGKYFEGKEALRAEHWSIRIGDEKTRGPVAAIHGRILLELGRHGCKENFGDLRGSQQIL